MRNLTILSEKPSQAAAYASAFEQSTRKKGDTLKLTYAGLLNKDFKKYP